MNSIQQLVSNLEARGHVGRFENTSYVCNCTKDPVPSRTGSNTRTSGTSNTNTLTRAASTTPSKMFDPAAYAAQLTRLRNLSTSVRYVRATEVDTTKNMVIDYRSGYAFFVPRPKSNVTQTIPDSVKDQIQNSDVVNDVVVPKKKQPVLTQDDINDINDTSNLANQVNDTQNQNGSPNTGQNSGGSNTSQSNPSNTGQNSNASQNNNNSAWGQQDGGNQYSWTPSGGGNSTSNSAQNSNNKASTDNPTTTGNQGGNTTDNIPKSNLQKAGGLVLGIAVVSLLLGGRFFGSKEKNNKNGVQGKSNG